MRSMLRSQPDGARRPPLASFERDLGADFAAVARLEFREDLEEHRAYLAGL